MQHADLGGLYPFWVEEIAKADTCCCDVDEIAAVLQRCICRHGEAVFIAVFDHYGLNLRLGESLPFAMQDAKAILFCPNTNLLTPARLALCPCTIGVADMGNRFVISFPDMTSVFHMETLFEWVEALRAADNLKR